MAGLYNRVKMTTATTGTGTVTLGSAAANNYCTFAEAGVPNAKQVRYVIEEGTDFEIGLGTYTSAGTTLSRDSVTLSKISGTAGTTKMTLAGAATVRIDAAAEDLNNGGLTTGQIPGTTTNDAASSGNHGEYVSSTIDTAGGLVSLVSATPKTITSISLTAGDWDVEYLAVFKGTATTTYTYLVASIVTTTNTDGTLYDGSSYQIDFSGSPTFANVSRNINVGPLRMSLSSTTTVYATADASFGASTLGAAGTLRARRVR